MLCASIGCFDTTLLASQNTACSRLFSSPWSFAFVHASPLPAPNTHWAHHPLQTQTQTQAIAASITFQYFPFVFHLLFIGTLHGSGVELACPRFPDLSRWQALVTEWGSNNSRFPHSCYGDDASGNFISSFAANTFCRFVAINKKFGAVAESCCCCTLLIFWKCSMQECGRCPYISAPVYTCCDPCNMLHVQEVFIGVSH